jgi:hypothetical protein
MRAPFPPRASSFWHPENMAVCQIPDSVWSPTDGVTRKSHNGRSGPALAHIRSTRAVPPSGRAPIIPKDRELCLAID